MEIYSMDILTQLKINVLILGPQLLLGCFFQAPIRAPVATTHDQPVSS